MATETRLEMVSSIDRAVIAALQGQPAHRTFALLAPDCTTCGLRMNASGIAQYDDSVITLWECVTTSADGRTCVGPSVRLTTALVDAPQSESDVIADLDQINPEETPALEISNEIPKIVHTVKLAKEAGRALDDNKSDIQIASVINAAMTQARTRGGWRADFAEPNRAQRYHTRGDGSRGYVYTVEVLVTCEPNRLRGTIGQEFVNIVATMDDKAKLPANRWRVAEIDGVEYVPVKAGAIEVDNNEEIGYVPLEIPADDEWVRAFDHLYGMDDYIQIIKATLEAAVASRWEQRINIELVGPPACGKSELCKALTKLLGAEAVLEFDGTSTTMAGAQANLAEREELPRVLIIEEIEKAPESSLPWLLSVLDLRGEVRKTTARGDLYKKVHMVGICTVNNQEVFEKLASGALASRFSMPLTFQRPTREILWKILYREIAKCNGSEEWIEPTLKYAEEIGLTDPRKMIAICLTGRDRLLDGTFQKMLDRTSPPRLSSTPSAPGMLGGAL